MTEEIKLRIPENIDIEEKLDGLGGEFDHSIEAVDTYFDISGKSVLKIREDSEGDWLVRFEPSGDGFEKTEEVEIEDVEELKQELEKKHGVKAVLDKEMDFCSWNDFTVIVNRIEDVGDFLILEGENPTKETVEEEFGLEDPEYITVPFSDLAD